MENESSKNKPFISNRIWALIVLLIFSFFIWNAEYNGKKFVEKIAKSPALTTGIILEVNYSKSQGTYVRYSFLAKEKTISSTETGSGIRSFMTYKSFPVIYDSLHPENNYMLITPEQFETFNIPFPDSLKWVLPYVDN